MTNNKFLAAILAVGVLVLLALLMSDVETATFAVVSLLGLLGLMVQAIFNRSKDKNS
jgi:hypothetical protein